MCLQMGRARINMELLKNEKSRNLSFHKRMSSLHKKRYELSILCGIKVCMIIYGPENRPEIRPQDRAQVLELINKYRKQSKADRKRRTVNISEYYADRKRKAKKELDKIRQINEDKAKFPTWDFWYKGLSEGQIRKIVSVLDSRLEDAKAKYKLMNSPYASNCYKSSSIFDQPYDFQINQNLNNLNFMPNMVRLIDGHDYSGDPVRVDPVVYNDPMMAGMVESMNYVNNLIRAPPMRYYGEAMQQALPHYYMEYPNWAGTGWSQMGGAQLDDYEDCKNADYKMKSGE